MSKASKRIVLIVVIGVVSLACLIGVIYGVSTHTEPTFMKVCWDNREAHFDSYENKSCDEPEELIWKEEQFPLTVTVSAYEGEVSASMKRWVSAAIDLINIQLGYRHFKLIANPESDFKPTITVIYGVPYESGTSNPADRAPGVCSVTRSEDGNIYGEIKLRGVGDIGLMYRVIVHEFGHCGMGLAHDDYKDSIMYPIQSMKDASIGGYLRFSDTDVEAVSDRYNR